jgi:hypothetical protein
LISGVSRSIFKRQREHWIQPDVRKGMLSIDKGYYFKKSHLLREGLKQVGLIQEHFPDSLISSVEGMILRHIGGETSNQQFKVLHFTKSFEKLFQFLLKEKIVLSSDFLYLGVYLASLYLHLERLGGAKQIIPKFLGAIRALKESGFRNFVTLGETLESWQEEIVRMWRFKKTNSIVEGMHTRMEELIRRAYGFRKFENFRLRARLFLG